MSRLTIRIVKAALEATKPHVEAVLKNDGFIPSLIGASASAPETLAFYQEVGKMNGASGLTADEVGAIQIIAARTNKCGFCVAGHAKLVALKKPFSEQSIEAARVLAAGEFGDTKLSVSTTFTQTVMVKKGVVSNDELKTFFDVGYNQQQVVGVATGVALVALCNCVGNLTETGINSELQAPA